MRRTVSRAATVTTSPLVADHTKHPATCFFLITEALWSNATRQTPKNTELSHGGKVYFAVFPDPVLSDPHFHDL